MNTYQINKKVAELLGLQVFEHTGKQEGDFVVVHPMHFGGTRFNPCNNWQDTGLIIDWLEVNGYEIVLNDEHGRTSVTNFGRTHAFEGETKQAICQTFIAVMEG